MGLACRADGTYVDATFGAGGHTARDLGAARTAGRVDRVRCRSERRCAHAICRPIRA